MSTCPDSDLYSAYVDNEVPSPWKEKLESHIASCPDCRKRAERYRVIKNILGADTVTLSGTELETSLARLEARRKFAEPRLAAAWTQFSIRIPVPALAALFLAAVFLPSYFVMRTNTRAAGSLAQSAADFTQSAALLPGISTSGATISQTMKALSTSASVYSPDLASYANTANILDANHNRIFTMINFARQFATDKELFSDAEIIIIKLPDLTRFSNTGEQLFSTGEILPQAAGFDR